MNIHILSLPHTQLTSDYVCCAYTQKVVKLCKMLVKEGMDVTVYAGEQNETPARLVTCITKPQQKKYGFETPDTYSRLEWNPEKPIWLDFHASVIRELSLRVAPGDVIGTFSGWCDSRVKDAFPQCRFVELGIGYEGVFSDYCIYESWAWLHTICGQKRNAYHANGRFYDTVIPNFFDPNDFPYSDRPEDYVLFVGRMIERKGLQIVSDLAKRFPETRFIMAGPGATKVGNEIRFDFRQENGKTAYSVISGENLQYIGAIDAGRRATLMSNAKALICPTLYIGPFEGVHVEAMMCGTPVLTTPFGAFSETYTHGVHGFKCHTIKEFADGLNAVDTLDRKAIREYAQGRYSMDVVAKQYVKYFELLDGLSRGGFYE